MNLVWIIPEERKPLTRKEVAELFLRQDGKCPICGQKLHTKGHMPVEFIDEHMKPLWVGGTNALRNRGLVCKPCAKVKTATETGERAKGYRVRDKHIGAVKPKRSSFATNRDGPFKAKVGGGAERRE